MIPESLSVGTLISKQAKFTRQNRAAEKPENPAYRGLQRIFVE